MNEIAALLRDFGQGASNAAASNVSGPVDLLAWALRKGGVPVPSNPILGSEWMRQKGLLADPRNKIAGLLGEAAGLSAPIAAAAKAPQIARGLLAADDVATAGANRMADHFERTGAAFKGPPNQRGAIVWHGSPHKFDAFDASKIGTGEGAQAYGHGLYLADSPDVARTYSADRAYVGASMAGKPLPINYDDPAWIAQKTMDELGDAVKAKAHLEMVQRTAGKYQPPETKAAVQGAIDMISAGKVGTKGSLYKVDLPDEKIARMLDWDKPLSQQPEAIQRLAKVHARDFAAEDALIAKAKELGVPVTSLPEYAQLEKAMDKAAKQSRITGADLYERFGGKATGAEKLRQAGIPGIRYLDGGSRGAGTGTSNYVVFPGEESALRILERNGNPINALVQALKGPR